jgi:folate-binding protein YgfZ
MSTLPLQTAPQSAASAPEPALAALLTSAAFAPLDSIGWLRVTGADRVRWLNGMVTNSIQALKPGEGGYSFVLNAQGRIQADLTAWMLKDSILLQTASPGTLATLLDHFIIMDDVELEVVESGSRDRRFFAQNFPEKPVTPVTLAGSLVAGPQALAIMGALGTANQHAAPCSSHPTEAPQPAPSDALSLKQTVYAGAPVWLIRAHSPLVPRFEIWSDPSTITRILDELRGTHALPASEADLEALRLLEGTPLYGTDIRGKDLPQETSQTRALHFAKGCYLGQEIVERIRSRGNVHRTFTGFILTGDLPPVGSPLTTEDAPDKPIGELTSAAAINLPGGPIQIALGYIRREALDRNASIQYAGGTATPSALPFPAAQSQASHPKDSASD